MPDTDDARLNRPHGELSQFLLRVGESSRGRRAVTGSPAAREVAQRFIAAERADEVLALAERDEDRGLRVTLEPLLGVAHDREQAGVAVNTHLDLLRRLGERELGGVAEVSIRLSTLGLGMGADTGLGPGRVGERLATENLATICHAARNAGALCTLDMEDHTTVDATFAAFSAVQPDFAGLGVTVQSQLRRTLADCRWLATTPTRVRLCKGGYSEPRPVSYPTRHQIDTSFVRCLGVLMAGKGYPMVATHDPRLVKIADSLAERTHRTGDDYEFQMYYGVRPWEHRRLVDTGHRVRVHLPFGEDWYAYLARRVAERPANVGPLLRALVTRR